MEQNKRMQPPLSVAVTLTPLNFEDPIERRFFTLSSGTDEIVIGRSSKVPTKALSPARDNAWFDSRVMSRRHAIITVCPQKKELSVTDTASMHGTWLNGTKLVSNNRTLLMNRDILTFGTKVTRGSETFEPMKVRLVLSWTREEKSTPMELPKPIKRHSENTFAVPDDDDDDDDQNFDDPQAEAIFENTSDIEVLPREPSVVASSDVVSISSSIHSREQQAESSPPSSPHSKFDKFEDKHDDSRNSKQESASTPPAAQKIRNHSINLEDNQTTGHQVSQPPTDVVARPESEGKTATPIFTESEGNYNAESGEGPSQLTDENLYSGSDSERENDKFGLEREVDSDFGQPPNNNDDDDNNHNNNASHKTKDGIPYSSAPLKNTTSVVPGKRSWASEHADKTSHPEFSQPAITAQYLRKHGENGNNGCYNFITSAMPGEQSSTVQPSALSYTPGQTEATRKWDTNLSPCSQRAPSPSDKALARPAIGDSHMPYSEDNPGNRWTPAANTIQRAFGNSGAVGPESAASAYGVHSSITTSGYEFPHLPPMRRPYSDGPFAASKQGDNNWLTGGDKCVAPPSVDNKYSFTYTSNSANDQTLAENTRELYQFGSSFSPVPVCGAFSAPTYSNLPPSQTQWQSQWQQACQNMCDVSAHQPQPKPGYTLPNEPKPATSIPIANIVDAQDPELNQPTNPLKRKAKEAELEPVREPKLKAVNDFYNGNDSAAIDLDPDHGDDFQPAQPREALPYPNPVSLHRYEDSMPKIGSQKLDPILITPETSESEATQHGPPPKKIKTTATPVSSRETKTRTSFGRYAASALLGAAVGGISVVAALASLPPDFFN
ncbi:hypothetical protein AJ78_06330 [Emergomyces pasteurianus Ep9510]|uniref:FHA domain-containing protein n=1 Tax=Emergomyces pasteurianus Ep9510 TaxID=1447872 RepID=A0A1J9PZ69_9EURO|nr:hypothetical protein AJ78_06330 [Emergomyces pasteurianus Ep9510]